jgi:hypothetical protein
MSRAFKVGLTTALVTACLGFGILCLFWFFGDWNPDLPGLFDYRAATVGDGFLLPLLLGVLAGAAFALKEQGFKTPPWSPFLLGALGLTIGLATQAVWLGDDSPEFNWTWEEPHRFRTPGYFHGAFLVTASAALAYLLARVTLTYRTAPRRSADKPSLGAGWLAMAVFAGVALVGLILRDNGRADETVAGLATVAAVVIGASAAVGLAFWAMGRKALPAAAVGLGGAIGLIGLCWVWPPERDVFIVWAVVVALPLVMFMTAPLAGEKLRWPTTLSIGLLTVGTAVIAGDRAVDGEGYAAAAAVIAGGILVALIPVAVRQTKPMLFDAFGVAGFVIWILAALTVAASLEYDDPGSEAALVRISVVEFFFDILVFTLFRDRFRRLVDDEHQRQTKQRPDWMLAEFRDPKKRPKVEAPEEAAGYVPNYPTLFFAAFAGLLAVAALIGFGADSLGIDRLARPGEPDGETISLLGGAALAAALGALVALLLAPRRQKRIASEPLPELRLPQRSLLVAFAATGLWVLVPILAPSFSDSSRHLEGLTLIPALAYGIFTAESLLSTPTRLQLNSPGRAGWALSILAGAANASALWWLLSVGIWSGNHPAEIGPLLAVTGITLVGSALLAMLIGLLFDRHSSQEQFTPGPAADNVLLDHGLYVLYMILLALIPMGVIAHVKADPSAVRELISSLAFIPGLVGVFIWVVDNNAVHHTLERDLKNPTKPIWDRAKQIAKTNSRPRKASWSAIGNQARELLGSYKRAMWWHSRIQNWGSVGLLILTMGAVGAHLLSA